MFIAGVEKPEPTAFGGAECNEELQHARTVPLLRTPPEGFWSSSYKHATPNGVKLTHY